MEGEGRCLGEQMSWRNSESEGGFMEWEDAVQGEPEELCRRESQLPVAPGREEGVKYRGGGGGGGISNVSAGTRDTRMGVSGCRDPCSLQLVVATACCVSCSISA